MLMAHFEKMLSGGGTTREAVKTTGLGAVDEQQGRVLQQLEVNTQDCRR
jgi:hypothetical protein